MTATAWIWSSSSTPASARPSPLCNRVDQYSTSPDVDVLDRINGGDNAWRELLDKCGVLQRIQTEYRNAINAALPDDISLCGDMLIGPYYGPGDEAEDNDLDGYPTDKHGGLDSQALVEDIDLDEIIERNEPLTLQNIGLRHLKSQSKNPAKVAAAAMSRLGLKAFTHIPHSQSGRQMAVYLKGDVERALNARPGRRRRTTRETVAP
ncbi:hypothetical protein AB0A98_06385 [Streptomyces chrestomyceticus]|uniref:hypothetical protein n=1 Tax=Streptomyces chrestomyceticus TaxID=68185 RepID=UPI0033EA365D